MKVLLIYFSDAKVRLVTLELTIRLLSQLVMHANSSYLQDCHLAAIEGAKEESSSVLRNFYKVGSSKVNSQFASLSLLHAVMHINN